MNSIFPAHGATTSNAMNMPVVKTADGVKYTFGYTNSTPYFYATAIEKINNTISINYKSGVSTIQALAVYKKRKRYITRDLDGHKGAAWKGAKSIKGLSSQKTRTGTYDHDLKRIGD